MIKWGSSSAFTLHVKTAVILSLKLLKHLPISFRTFWLTSNQERHWSSSFFRRCWKHFFGQTDETKLASHSSSNYQHLMSRPQLLLLAMWWKSSRFSSSSLQTSKGWVQQNIAFSSNWLYLFFTNIGPLGEMFCCSAQFSCSRASSMSWYFSDRCSLIWTSSSAVSRKGLSLVLNIKCRECLFVSKAPAASRELIIGCSFFKLKKLFNSGTLAVTE